ncbi:amidase [Ketogulonicigenium vulgare]|uniref:Glutamyl-tRNA amidotransferase subunit A protein n=1 Tax=Ketogulonicigenium vulgare (strain WSH-001) TaxID=759362 RepID=F9Y5M0_KETVW|nr:amidase [Ketogulonicigenium vulgare]ADO42579.1 amidase [Ketogulonicigenium vulgare Y25]AEM40773.1 Glutamyl-tRNA amidotransferase subunit A protein [Ketogulonicigenium vulgare WSH-001]ALJ80940.1 amidase [Ketogulonicigenium vulgare]ANW33710.1 amidase [Ketogulonicigenium vulgare]AOZ54491.1 amidase [Ketogulonicigenium vulgare]
MSEILDKTARETIAAFTNKQLSPVEYMQALITRVEASEPKVGALYAFKPEESLAAARAAEARYMAGAPMGRLDGMPISVKELIATKGDPIPLGTAAVDLVPATEDAPTAARLKEDGAIIFAKTTCPDYGMLSSGLSTFHQLSRNPWKLSENTGGSSAGAAAAAAAGYGPLHIGTDIGGSVRLPAGWTGLFGFKPSLGRMPIDPYMTGRCAGPMTPTVDDAAFVMPTVTRPDWRDATSLPYEALDWDVPAADVRGLKIGLMLDAGCGIDAEPEVIAAVQAAADLFAAHGAEIIPVAPVLTREMLDGLDVAWRARFWGKMELLSPEKRALVLPYIYDWAKNGGDARAVDVARGFDQTFEMRRTSVEVFQKVDIILSPVNPNVSYPADWASPTNDPAKPFEHICFTVPWNMGEQPAASINCGYSSTGMPIGLQIVASRFEDLKVFSIAKAYENWRGPILNWPRHD